MSTTITQKQKIKLEIEKFINSNMPKISSHGGSFAIYELDLQTKFIRIKFAGSCTTCMHGGYKFNELRKRIPQNISEIDHVRIDFV